MAVLPEALRVRPWRFAGWERSLPLKKLRMNLQTGLWSKAPYSL